MAIYQIRGHENLNNDDDSRMDDHIYLMSLATERSAQRFKDSQDKDKNEDPDFDDKIERSLDYLVPKSIRVIEKRLGIDKLQLLING